MIDDCASNFADIAAVILPNHMARMRAAIAEPRTLNEFCTYGIGLKTMLRRLGQVHDLSGCYVLLRHDKPFYVGISRGVVGRLRQHGMGKTHFDASLAYRMACEKIAHETTRNEAMKNPAFRQAFDEAQQLLLDSNVAFIEISNPLELYLFEAYCAMELNTSEWNTFRTH
jgi:hypothetical protein